MRKNHFAKGFGGVRRLVHQIMKTNKCHLSPVVSGHADHFAFILADFEISVSKVFASSLFIYDAHRINIVNKNINSNLPFQYTLLSEQLS